MAHPVHQIEEQIRALATADRDRLIRNLLGNLDGKEDHGVEAAWLAEAQERYEGLKSGAVKAVPAAEVIRKARAGLKHGG